MITRTIAIVFVAQCLLALVLRLPYFFQSVIDWDESAFILMGQDILNGHLPLTHLWDIKPPLAFVPYALLQIFGKSIPMIRLGGLLCVAFSATCIFYVCARHWTREAAIWASCLFTIFVGLCGEATFVEHFALIPLSLALIILMRTSSTSRDCAAAGLAVGLSTLIRTNLLYLMLPVMIFAVFGDKSRSRRERARRALTGLAGFATPLALVAAIYYLAGSIDVLWRTNVLLPLAYVDIERQDLFSKITGLFGLICEMSRRGWLIWCLGAIGCAIIAISRDQRRNFQTLIVVLFLFAILLSIAHMGHQYPHYLIDAMPPLAMLAGLAISTLSKARWRYLVYAVVALGVWPPVHLVINDYLPEANYLITNNANDTARGVADYLAQQSVKDQYVFLQDYYICYWYTGAKMPTTCAHSNNLFNEPMLKAVLGPQASVRGELDKIFSHRPIFVVTSDFYDSQPGNALSPYLAADYNLVATINTAHIYKRRAK